MFRINIEKTSNLWCGVFLSLGHTRVAPRGTSSWKGIRWMNTLTVLVAFLVVYISKQAGLSSWLKINTCWIQIAEFTGYSFLLRCLAYRPFKWWMQKTFSTKKCQDSQSYVIAKHCLSLNSKLLIANRFPTVWNSFPGPLHQKLNQSPHVCFDSVRMFVGCPHQRKNLTLTLKDKKSDIVHS